MKRKNSSLLLCFLLFIFCFALSAEPPRRIFLFYVNGLKEQSLKDWSLYAAQNSITDYLSQLSAAGKVQPETARTTAVDPAAAATAFACGQKTKSGYIGVDENCKIQQSLAFLLYRHGWRTALLTLSPLNDPVPAAFYAHVDSPDKKVQAAAELPFSDFDFICGGALTGSPLEKEVIARSMKRHSYTVLSGINEWKSYSGTGRLMLTFSPEKKAQIPIPEQISIAISRLQRKDGEVSPEPFAVFICLDGPVSSDAIFDLNEAAGRLIYMAEKDGNGPVLIVIAGNATGNTDQEKTAPVLVSEEYAAMFRGTYGIENIYKIIADMLQQTESAKVTAPAQ